jgi:hypothetical protein
MNPRIREVTVLANATSTPFTLDITKRELQKLPLRATGKIRIIITGVEMGTKDAWREIAISELEAWGTPPATWKTPAKPFTPVVRVASAITRDELDPCTGMEAERAAFEKEHAHDDNSGPGGEDHAYPPRCDLLDLPALPAGWSRAGAGCRVGDEIYGPKTCSVSFARGATKASVELTDPAQSADISIASITAMAEVHGIAIRFHTSRGDFVGVCRDAPLACAAPFQISGTDWTTKQHFTADGVVIEATSGSPPTDLIGSYSLVFK